MEETVAVVAAAVAMVRELLLFSGIGAVVAWGAAWWRRRGVYVVAPVAEQ